MQLTVSDRPASLDDLEGAQAPRRSRRSAQRERRQTTRRYEWTEAGALLHIDAFELPQVRAARALGARRPLERHAPARPARSRSSASIDDHTRLVYCELHAAENAATVSATLRRAAAWFREQGCGPVQAVMSDNAKCYARSHGFARHARRARRPPHPDPALHTALERQDRALLPHARHRMGAQPHLAHLHATRPRPVIVHPLLQPPPTALSRQRPSPHHPRSPSPRAGQLAAATDPKDGVQGRDPTQVFVWRIGADTLKEGTDLPSPFLQVRAEKQHLLVVGILMPYTTLRDVTRPTQRTQTATGLNASLRARVLEAVLVLEAGSPVWRAMIRTRRTARPRSATRAAARLGRGVSVERCLRNPQGADRRPGAGWQSSRLPARNGRSPGDPHPQPGECGGRGWAAPVPRPSPRAPAPGWPCASL